MKRILTALALACSLGVIDSEAADSTAPRAPDRLQLNRGDHIAIIGNTLADRFQHSGWLESFIYAQYPEQDLVFRNLAVAGDEVSIRHRPADFGTADEWLKKVQADVIFAFFGFNESFAGPDGLSRFKANLDRFLKNTAKENYSGKGAPRIVLFSPIANEKHSDSNLPDPTANNRNIRLYAEAMRELAAANGVLFVDLLEPSIKLYADAAQKNRPLTIDGMHLTEIGDELIAQVIRKQLFGEDQKLNLIKSDPPGFMARLRLAV